MKPTADAFVTDQATKSYNSSPVLELNLKNKKIRDFVLDELITRCDILIESYRPGVTERFGLDPEVIHARNKKIIYVRVSGYGHLASNQQVI